VSCNGYAWPDLGGKPVADGKHEDGCVCFSAHAGALYEWNMKGDAR